MPQRRNLSIGQSSRLNILKETSTQNWLRKRYPNKTKEKYLYSDQERVRCQEIIDIFQKFDEDGSGTLEIEEIYEMFRKIGLNMSKNEVYQIFSIVD